MHHFLKSKNMLVAALATTVCLSFSTSSFAAYFSDIQQHWAKKDIQVLVNMNILGGYPDGSFQPDGLITRAEFAAVLVKAAGLKSDYMDFKRTTKRQSFQDVSSDGWAYSLIETVRDNGLVTGYPGGFFMPDQHISRAEAMVILVNAAHIPLPTVREADNILSKYDDAHDIPDWARRGVAAGISAGILNRTGLGNQIEPLRPATRGEIASMTRFALIDPSDSNYIARSTFSKHNTYNSRKETRRFIQDQEVTIPVETKLITTLLNDVDTLHTRVGDRISVRLDRPSDRFLPNFDGHFPIPVGTEIVGRVTEAKTARQTNQNGLVSIRFEEMILPDGERIEIEAYPATEDWTLKARNTDGYWADSDSHYQGSHPQDHRKATPFSNDGELFLSRGDRMEIQLLKPIIMDSAHRLEERSFDNHRSYSRRSRKSY